MVREIEYDSFIVQFQYLWPVLQQHIESEEKEPSAADEPEDEPSASVLVFSLDMLHPRTPDFMQG